MLNWSLAPTVYLFTRIVDMRSGFDRLAELVREELGVSPLNGSLFVFVGRGGRRVKMLLWERDGFWLFYRRLEVGAVRLEIKEGYQLLTGIELKHFLDGLELSRINLRKDVENGVYI